MPLNLTKSRQNNLHHSHQHIFQHQSSVSSTTSVQTVFHNVDINNGDHLNSINSNINTNNTNTNSTASSNQMLLLGTSSSSTSFQSTNGAAHSSVNATNFTGKSSVSRTDFVFVIRAHVYSFCFGLHLLWQTHFASKQQI